MSAFRRDRQLRSGFEPGRPEAGYYNDLRGVAREYGSPQEALGWLEVLQLRRDHANPVSILQLGLGAWQLDRDTPGEGWEHVARSVTAWISADATDDGLLTYRFDMPHTFELAAPWASALAQGQAASLLVRMPGVLPPTRDAELLGLLAGTLLGDAGGLLVELPEGPILEEYPTSPPSLVLNGAVFATFGLLDLAACERLAPDLAERCEQMARATADTIAATLGEWELPSGWTAYDRHPHPIRHVASPFYHDLHVELVGVLAELLPDPAFAVHLERWQAARERRLTVAAAVARKVAFRLLRPRSGRRAA